MRDPGGVTFGPFHLPAHCSAPCSPALSFPLMPSNSPVCCQFTVVQLPIQRSTTSEQRDGTLPPCSVFGGLFVVVLHKQEGKKAFACDPAHITVGLIKALCAASSAICSHCLRPETWQEITLDFMLTQRQRGSPYLRKNLCDL